MARLSSNWLLARLSGLYIELVRNIPLLLQMFVWYAALLFGLPGPGPGAVGPFDLDNRSEEHTSELQSLMRISYAVFCLKNKKQSNNKNNQHNIKLENNQ